MHKGTLDKKAVNQIDHILIENKHFVCIEDVRSYRGETVDTDHVMAKIRMQQTLSKSVKANRNRRSLHNTQMLTKKK